MWPGVKLEISFSVSHQNEPGVTARAGAGARASAGSSVFAGARASALLVSTWYLQKNLVFLSIDQELSQTHPYLSATHNHT